MKAQMQRVIARERIQRQADQRHAQYAHRVAEAGELLVIGRYQLVTAVVQRPAERDVPISWAQYAERRGWIEPAGDVQHTNTGWCRAWRLTALGRRLAAQHVPLPAPDRIGLSDVLALPGRVTVQRIRDELGVPLDQARYLALLAGWDCYNELGPDDE